MVFVKGYKMSEEHKQKIGAANLGKMKPTLRNKKRNPEIGRRISLSKLGHEVSEETKEKIREKRALQIITVEHRQKISEAHKGAKSHFWKGGLTPLNKIIRNSAEFANWRKSVFERDDYTCQQCRERGGLLEADHIKPFALFPELRFELSNGRTLCKDCHKKTDTYGSNGHKFKRELLLGYIK